MSYTIYQVLLYLRVLADVDQWISSSHTPNPRNALFSQNHHLWYALIKSLHLPLICHTQYVLLLQSTPMCHQGLQLGYSQLVQMIHPSLFHFPIITQNLTKHFLLLPRFSCLTWHNKPIRLQRKFLCLNTKSMQGFSWQYLCIVTCWLLYKDSQVR